MRVLVVIVIFIGGLLPLDSMADAARKSKRSTKPPQQKVDLACEARARHEDPSGDFAGYPCWAREALARGRNIDNR
jgi:hypothetical protein